MNLAVALLVLGGGASLMWTGIRDPKDGLFGAVKSVLRGRKIETNTKPTSTAYDMGNTVAWLLQHDPEPTPVPMPDVGQDPSGGFAPVSTATGAAGAVLAEAATWLGVPYLWGGRTKAGADCSGFVQSVFKKAAGIDPGSWTGTQMGNGQSIPAGSAGPGDLVFWGGAPGVHVGIVVDRAGGTMIHAPKPGSRVRYEGISPSIVPGQPMSYRRYLGGSSSPVRVA